jgi:hypothetical protein
VLAPLPAAAPAAAATLADWRLDEASGSRTMLDSSPSGLHGRIGSQAYTGVFASGARGYFWSGQTGQATTAGGYFEVDMVQGRVMCLFKGPEGTRAIGSAQTVWDAQWHTIRCERRADRVMITVDGGTPRSNWGPTGRIANKTPLTIGGKIPCSPPKVGCDYYAGHLDYVRVERF